MINGSFFTSVFAGVLGLLFGTALLFTGYRFFRVLLSIWGFIFGMAMGGQAMQVLFGGGFLATVTSWVVGLIVGCLFALLSYFLYRFAVGLAAGSLGYTAAVALLTWIGLEYGFFVWLIAVITGLVFGVAALLLNLQKWIIIAATSILGAATIFGTILLMFKPADALLKNPVRVLLSTSPFLFILFLVVANLGFLVQAGFTGSQKVEAYQDMGNSSG